MEQQKLYPLTELCEVYKFSFNRAMELGFNNLLRLQMKDGEVSTTLNDFCGMLQILSKIGEYSEMMVCDKCGKELPLCYFSYTPNQGITSICKDCERVMIAGENNSFYGMVGENKQPLSIKKYESTEDFEGEWFLEETYKGGVLIDCFQMRIVTAQWDEGTYVLIGKLSDGRLHLHRLSPTEVETILYEGATLFYNKDSSVLHKKVLFHPSNT